MADSRTKILLVGCGKSKLQTHPEQQVIAEELYTGPIFRARANHAKLLIQVSQLYSRWYIVSALYGLIHPEELVESYDLTVKQLSPLQKQQWSHHVLGDVLDSFEEPVDLRRIVIELHMGADYAELLADKIVACGMNYSWPVKGLGQGEQLAWYKQRFRNPQWQV